MGNIYTKYKLKKLPFNSLDYFELTANKIYDAKVVSVYDGDTCHIAIKHYGKFYKIRVRINGIDAPEMKPIHIDNNDIKNEIKQKAKSKTIKEFFDKYNNRSENIDRFYY